MTHANARKSRYDTYDEAGLQDHSSVPHSSPSQTPPEVVERIERLRRDNEWSARRIALEPTNQGVRISERTVGRWLVRPGTNHRRYLDPDGSINRHPSQQIVARYPGHMVHLDVEKAAATVAFFSRARAFFAAERTRAIAVWNVHHNHHRPHTTAGNRPPA